MTHDAQAIHDYTQGVLRAVLHNRDRAKREEKRAEWVAKYRRRNRITVVGPDDPRWHDAA